MADSKREGDAAEGAPAPDRQQPSQPSELIDTGVDVSSETDNEGVDRLTREEVEADPGEATRKLPRNDQAQ